MIKLICLLFIFISIYQSSFSQSINQSVGPGNEGGGEGEPVCIYCSAPSFPDDPNNWKKGWPVQSAELSVDYKGFLYKVTYKIRQCTDPASKQFRIEKIEPEGDYDYKPTDRSNYSTDCEYLEAMKDMVSVILSNFVWNYAIQNQTVDEYWNVLMPGCMELFQGVFNSPIRIMPEGSDTYNQCTNSCCLYNLRVFHDNCNILKIQQNYCVPSSFTCASTTYISDDVAEEKILFKAHLIPVMCGFIYREGFTMCIPVCCVKITRSNH